MPLRLEVLRDETDEPVRAVVVDSPRVVLGRAQTADVLLPDPSVSPRHASLREHGASVLLVDEGSTNGTWIAGVRLASGAQRVVPDGAEIRLGRVWLRVGTRPTDPVSSREAIRALALSLVEQGLRALGEPAQPTVTVIDGPDRGRTLVLTGSHVVGRGASSDLVLEEIDASRRHVELTLEDGVVKVTDLGAKNGVYLGEQRLDRGTRAPWSPGERLHLGHDVLELSHPAGSALEEILRGEDERVPEASLPRRPGASLEPDERVEALAPEAAPARRMERGPAATGWGSTDAMVMVFAVVVLAVSAAGLAWLFR